MDPIILAERGLVPDPLLRRGIRKQLAERLAQEHHGDLQSSENRRRQFREELRESAITINTVDANEQHYEVPAALFELMLGPRLKYSSCWWDDNCKNLEESEEAMLRLYAERAQLADGQRILDMGCGWGSFTLWAAEHYPNSQLTAISNSHGQREYIEGQAAAKGLTNIKVITCDIAELELNERFDRVVTIEMMEHVRNYRELLANVSRWLEPEGLMFVHIFCHAFLHYPFDGGWMTDNFFSGGQMPAFDTLMHFSEHMRIVDSWRVNGVHYSKTLEAWLDKLDDNKTQALKILKDAPSPKVQLQRWRIFLLACSELFAYHGGQEWFVGHYLLTPGQLAD
ncbi:methyltransferase, cyclopropane fatty acid synthase [Spongiibacter sp. IMCC21906]|uniref:SAM-dependent methyltransferase n=1 Tax=Spongiibacter sp. IMCC21906 TaxID=1620392 RepID=UPI00062E073E|nr:cyclopropane-fatty-acyl-phospholipid synthase family protein [Spongiibacter sp. IMCC21906]AKH69382.1 methyltransferase, cyclopropane fatty acid synthase [Spongiibacter sp. IMCC21906]